MQSKPKMLKITLLTVLKERLVIINEAIIMLTIEFLPPLLKGLYKMAIVLGVEALDDTLINKRKFPIMDGGSFIFKNHNCKFIKRSRSLVLPLFNYEYKMGRP
jgi:hypothetical protein